MKRILFLSGIDFKSKSIQVIRKTPEAYAAAGWKVDYIVARDNCPAGNYFYESEINPDGIHVVSTLWPFPKLSASLARFPGLLLSKFASYIVIAKLFFLAMRQLDKHCYDVVYGYELQGVLTMNVLRLLRLIKKEKVISRFQGTFLNEMFIGKQYGRLLFNLDTILALWLHSDLLIMTNDGTQGDRALMRIKGKKEYRSHFWVNGVDIPSVRSENVQLLRQKYSLKKMHVFLSVSRLVGWKRVERGIGIMAELKEEGLTHFKYLIVGDGDARPFLEELVVEQGLVENACPIPQ